MTPSYQQKTSVVSLAHVLWLRIGGNQDQKMKVVEIMSATEEEKKIAQWMLEQLITRKHLSQRSAAHGIRTSFGTEHLYRNKQRNWAIKKPILEHFRTLTPENIVWSRGRQTWRFRRPGDPEGRMVR